MTLWRLAWRNLTHAWVSSLVTALACSLAGGLMMAVLAIKSQAQAAFISGAPGYDAVLGARGSPVQLVLCAVFQLETSPGNLPMSLVQQVRLHPGVQRAVPLAMGDNYRGFRVVGTTPDLFENPPPKGLRLTLRQGKWMNPARHQAVAGSFAAQRTGLTVGSHFQPAHGLSGSEQHEEEYEVVGILQATNTPLDRVIWIPLEGVYRMEGHVLRGHGEEYQARPGQPIPEEHQEVSAVLLQFAGPQVGFQLDQSLNKEGKTATLAYPIGRVVGEIFQKLGWAHQVLGAVAAMVMLVAAAAILASIYNALEGRRQEFATLRALGMPRRRLFQLLVLEASLIGLLGVLGSLVVYALLVWLVAHFLRLETGISLQALQFHPALILAPLGMLALAAGAGLIPAWRVYRWNVAESS